MKDRKLKQALSGGWYQGKEEDIRKVCRKENIGELLCTHA
jgi:hypothetical protein